MANERIATGRVESLCLDGAPRSKISFAYDGPLGDKHRGFVRSLSGHDGAYISTSALSKGHRVFNTRSWTGLSEEEIKAAETCLGVNIPQGCMLENLVFSGIPNFSKLLPTTRLVFPEDDESQLILVVWEENTPCDTVGERLENYHKVSGLKTRLIAATNGRRGVMGFVFSHGRVNVGDEVQVYPPVE
jgi:MOSC domain-containing protein YiiM